MSKIKNYLWDVDKDHQMLLDLTYEVMGDLDIGDGVIHFKDVLFCLRIYGAVTGFDEAFVLAAANEYVAHYGKVLAIDNGVA